MKMVQSNSDEIANHLDIKKYYQDEKKNQKQEKDIDVTDQIILEDTNHRLTRSRNRQNMLKIQGIEEEQIGNQWKISWDTRKKIQDHYGVLQTEITGTQLDPMDKENFEYLDFDISWQKWESNFLVTPDFENIMEVLKKIQKDQVASVLVFLPVWSSREWWKKVREMIRDVPLLIPRSPEIFTKGGQRIGRPSWHVMVVRLSGKPIIEDLTEVQETLDWLHRLRRDADIEDVQSLLEDLEFRRIRLLKNNIVRPEAGQ